MSANKASASSVATRNKTKIYLLGNEEFEITGSKLPSNRQVLKVFFYHHITLKKTIPESARIIIREASVFWYKARIPVRKEQHAVSQLIKLHDQWAKLKKNSKRTSATQKANEEKFLDSLDDLFDMAHTDALDLIKIQEDKDFLLAQRVKGRRGYLGPVDSVLTGKESRSEKRRVAFEERKQRAAQEQQAVAEWSDDTSSGSDAIDEGNDEVAIPVENPPTSCKKPKKQKLITPGLASTLDRAKLSDRKATFVLAATANSLGHNVDDLTISHATIRRERQRIRKETANKLKEEFVGESRIVVHWDGKLLPSLTGKELVDRLPVIVSCTGIDQLLGVPKLLSGTGEAQASGVAKLLNEWDLVERVCAMCFDTTPANTGRLNGACTLLEQQLGKDLLYLACRHHVYELVLKAAFEETLGCSTSSGPDIALFKRFQHAWARFDRTKFNVGISDPVVLNTLKDDKDSIIDFVKGVLQSDVQPRDDYREFLELIIIFLGGDPVGDLSFKVPGALHHARWMAKAIYSLKVFMFEGQFKLISKEHKGLRDFCLFVVRLYCKRWFTATFAASSPRNDLSFLQELVSYETVNAKVAKAAFSKFTGHLWYLSEELVGLAFFDSSVTVECKRDMVRAITEREGMPDGRPPKRHQLDITQRKEIMNLTVADFVTRNTLSFFNRLCISTDFMRSDPEEWNDREDYNQGLHIVRHLKVVNDNAERGVALITEFNALITKDEDQKQFLLQVVSDHRRQFPTCRKSDLTIKE